eukprot:TRINITY_DN7480_c0_g1_i7.p1 TRINITY_DN7480_c0_g1~~TRINITY_DN7480_c0_g1_i7.p1  ORF type:complete len:199 (+),score=24.42 TRINITY_DN7480_c0_g1_i7:77-673(+)
MCIRDRMKLLVAFIIKMLVRLVESIAKTLARRHIFIESFATPNPMCLKFVPGKTVFNSTRSKEYNNITEANESLLAKRLFFVEGVNRILLGPDFISITKSENADWNTLKPEVLAALTEFFATQNPPPTNPSIDEVKEQEEGSVEDETASVIEDLISVRVAPSLQEDGGDIEFRGYDSARGVLTLTTIDCIRHIERSVH